MNARAIDPMGTARIDDVRDPYRAERLRAQMRADRVARPQAPPFAGIQAARPPAVPTGGAPQKPVIVRKDDRDQSVNPLRDQYAAHCLMHAIEAFHDQQAKLEAQALAGNQALKDEQVEQQARAEAANDLGTIQGLLPLQPYRVVAGVPPIMVQQVAAVSGAAPLVVGPVAHAAPLRNATDDALSTHASTRDRARRPRKEGA